MTNTGTGLHEKYGVWKDNEPVSNCFVLEPEDDPAARQALRMYADLTDNEELSEDLYEWVDSMEEE